MKSGRSDRRTKNTSKFDGYQFFLSANQVWLTREVPVRYLKKI